MLENGNRHYLFDRKNSKQPPLPNTINTVDLSEEKEIFIILLPRNRFGYLFKKAAILRIPDLNDD